MSARLNAALHSGHAMPVIGLGTWQAPAGQVKAAVIAAIEAGYRHVDCAAIYGNEAEIGEGLHDVLSRGVCKREELFVTSKLWCNRAHPEHVSTALAKTLADLQLSYLDLYLVHWPFQYAPTNTTIPAPMAERLGYTPEAYAAVWREMEAAVDAGKAKSIGTSNMSAKKLHALLATARIKPAVNQVESHPFLAQTALLAWCMKHGILITAYSPLGSPARPARTVEEGDPAPLHDATILRIAAKHGKSAAQVLIRWQMQRGVIVIPKSATPARIQENLAVGDFALDDEDMAAIVALDRGHRLIKGMHGVRDGETWQDLWDVDWEHCDAVPPAAPAPTPRGQ